MRVNLIRKICNPYRNPQNKFKNYILINEVFNESWCGIEKNAYFAMFWKKNHDCCGFDFFHQLIPMYFTMYGIVTKNKEKSHRVPFFKEINYLKNSSLAKRLNKKQLEFPEFLIQLNYMRS